MPSTDGSSTHTLTFSVLHLASGFIGVAQVGGISVRGGRRNTAFDAAQSLFMVLSGTSGNSDDAAIAVDLMLADETLSGKLAELTAGETPSDAG